MILARQRANVNDIDQIGAKGPFLVTRLWDEAIVRNGVVQARQNPR